VRLYLVCRFEGYDNERILALPRLLQATVGEESFLWPVDFDLEDYCNGGDFGISHGRKVRLQFRIDKVCGQHLLESPLSADQTAQECDDALSITATVVETKLLHRWLRGWGEAVKDVEIVPIESYGKLS
jgi:hypothetical protein